jgi:hypothetical protein
VVTLWLLCTPWSAVGQSHEEVPRAAAPAPAGLGARSFLVPGWGQIAQGQRRGVVYGVAEGAFWALWAASRVDAGRLRNGYRDLAWETARGAAGVRLDGAWPYYEAVSKWQRSGDYDRDPGLAGVQPEEDPSTHNGSVWSLAKGLHFGGGAPVPGDPRYEAALDWYASRAYDSRFLWDWTGREGDHGRYVDLIHRSDRRFQQATMALGAVLANHVLSGTDAFLSARLPGTTSMRLAPDWGAGASPIRFSLTWSPL